MLSRKFLLIGAIMMLFSMSSGFAATPQTEGWELKGNATVNYVWGIDPGQKHDGSNVAYLRFQEQKCTPREGGPGFGTILQNFAARRYCGKRMRSTGFLKTKDVADHSTLWMRIDGLGGKSIYDNMESRPLTGTNDWKKYDIVLDVPEWSQQIVLGAMLSGTGETWISGLKFEEVDKAVPVTAEWPDQSLDHPVNLDFNGSK
jgi:hypothetical protein